MARAARNGWGKPGGARPEPAKLAKRETLPRSGGAGLPIPGRGAPRVRSTKQAGRTFESKGG